MTKPALSISEQQREEIVRRLQDGQRVHEVAKSVGVRTAVVTKIRQESGLTFLDKSRSAVQARRDRSPSGVGS